MPLSLTCLCGARLEVDDKFAGQAIACPDCGKPITAPLPPKPPETTSGLALSSFLLAVIGSFTFIGTIAAVVCGYLALRDIQHAPKPLGGKNLARAGMILGGIFTLITGLALIFSERIGLDGYLLRCLELAGRLEYSSEQLVIRPDSSSANFSISRPSFAWGKFKGPSNTPVVDTPDAFELGLVNVKDDAHIICLVKEFEIPQKHYRESGLGMLRNSRLLKLLARVPEKSADTVQKLDSGVHDDIRQVGESDIEEFHLDARLAGIDRTFLIRVQREGPKIYVVAGGARKNRFAKIEKEQLRDAIESFKVIR